MAEYTQSSRGFTLIELLVVIAIIGILSAVVLASLNTARTKGNDAAVQADLSTIRLQAELYYSNNSSYTIATGGAINTATCSTQIVYLMSDPSIRNAVLGAKSASGADISCGMNASSYSFAAANSTGAWCIDSTGVSRNKNSSGVTYTGVTSGITPAHASAGAMVCQ